LDDKQTYDGFGGQRHVNHFYFVPQSYLWNRYEGPISLKFTYLP